MNYLDREYHFMKKEWMIGGGMLVAGFVMGYVMHTPQAAPSASDTTHSGMQMQMDDMTSSLRGKKDADFDKAFIDEMIVHHRGAVDMANLVLTNTSRGELKTMAEAIITAQSAEIAQMQQWRSAWFGGEQHH